MEKLLELSEHLCNIFGPEKMCKIIAEASEERIFEMLEEFGIW